MATWHHLEGEGKRPFNHVRPFLSPRSLNEGHDDSTASLKGDTRKESV